MSVDFVSTRTFLNGPLSAVRRLSADMVRLQKEASDGRHADVGLALGGNAGRASILHQEYIALGEVKNSNSQADSRLDITNTVLDGIRKTVDNSLATTLGSSAVDEGAKLIHDEMERNLKALLDNLNSSSAGIMLFGGIRTDKKPMQDASSVVSASFDQYLAVLGKSIEEVTLQEINTFLQGDFEAEVETNWATNWSSASDTVITSMISADETVKTSVSANASPFRHVVKAFAALGVLPTDKMNQKTFGAVIDYARAELAKALTGIEGVQSDVGAVKARIKLADENVKAKRDIIDKSIFSLEGVEQAKAKTELDLRSVQLQMSYSLIVGFQRISLLNYM